MQPRSAAKLLCGALLLASVSAQAADASSLGFIQTQALAALHGPDLRGKDGPMHKLGFDLIMLHQLGVIAPALSANDLEETQLGHISLQRSYLGLQSVLVNAIADDTHALQAFLYRLGAQDLSVAPPVVSGWVPVVALDTVAAYPDLKFMHRSQMVTRTGLALSQGDFALGAPTLRARGPTGAGVKVGVISDSFNCRNEQATDILNGEFPAGVTVRREIADCTTGFAGGPGTDEGRAMAQIVADVAPGSPLTFASGANGTGGIASAITLLAADGAKVIVDDLTDFSQPWFQDGVIQTAVNNAVLTQGVAYFSAAGNQAKQSYESIFRPASFPGIGGGPARTLHDFGSGRVSSSVFIPAGGTETIFMQWDQPAASACTGCPGSQSDLDIYFVDGAGNPLGTPTGINNNLNGDPFEAAVFTNTGAGASFSFVIERFAGASPGLVKLIYLRAPIGFFQDDTQSSTAVGPGQAANGVAVGAAEYFQTPACGTAVPVLAVFSSRGGVPTIFNNNGTRKTTPEIRQKPEFVAPQNGNTSFFGSDIANPVANPPQCTDTDTLPNFAGTSAAAPHAAGLAALLRQAYPTYSPQLIYEGMKTSALDMEAGGVDFDSGFGLLRADAAFNALVADSTPDSFSFASQSGQPTGQPVTSNTITIRGYTLPVMVSVSAGGSYSIGCTGTFTSADSTIQPLQTVCVRHTGSASFNTPTTTMLTVGGVTGSFTSTTMTQTLSASTPDINGQTVTFTTDIGSIANLVRVATPSAAPGTFSYPNGFFSFDIVSLPPAGGATATVTVTLPTGSAPTVYVKCAGASCAPFSGASIAGNIVTLTLVDNGTAAGGDSNAANGTISDPGGGGIPVPPPPPLASKFFGGGLSPAALLPLMLAFGLRRRKSPPPA